MVEQRIRSIFKMSDRDVLESNLGWKDEWKDDIKKVERVRNIKHVTVQVVLILFSAFFTSTRALFSFLEQVVPLGFSIPEFKKFCKLLDNNKKHKIRLGKSKNRGEQQMMEFKRFLLQPFFNSNSSSSSFSGPNSPHENSNSPHELQIETLKQEMGILKQVKEELDTLLTLEKTKSRDLQKKLDEVTLHFQKRIAGLASANSRLNRKLIASSACSPLDKPASVICSHDSHGLGFVVITKEYTDPRVFEGVKYFGSQSGKLIKTTGKPLIFFNFINNLSLIHI